MQNFDTHEAGDRLARRNALVLALSMVLAGANASVIVATGAILGSMLAPSPKLATLPVSAMVLGTAIGTFPASHFMKHVGRRAGFMTGGLLGVIGGLTGAFAIWLGSFWLFTFSAVVSGLYQAFIVLYRYAAADTASPEFRAKAISWVMVGGALSSLVGPQLVIATQSMLPPLTFLATYLAQAAFAVLAIIVTSRLIDGPLVTAEQAGAARPLMTILKDRRLPAAILTGMVAQAMMNMVMTATPIAMLGCGFSVTQSTLGIQWHILGMYLPSFFTGHLINRFGKGPMMLAGLAMLAGAGGINLAGTALANFWGSLIVIGIGWNFAFVAATALVTDCHAPAERAKVQGFTDLMIFGTTTIASLLAGWLYASFGWSSVNVLLLPVTALAAVAVLTAGLQRRP
ncbi:MAG TPA: MFS transporter [Beijerinckiaceae bacterium]|nr:MFS transporter [Beijerinckiaceae bacterium]